MRPETIEWVQKAEADFITAGREKDAAEYPNYDAACFHCQQSAEKYLKARLIESGKSFPKTHDLSALLNLVLPLEPSWKIFRDDLERLTDLGVEVRYPGTSADLEDAEEALHTACMVREFARKVLIADK